MHELRVSSTKHFLRLIARSTGYILTVGILTGCFPAVSLRAQPMARQRLEGYFLTDSIEIGRPFRYALTYRHLPTVDVLFPDTARHFAPYQVKEVAVFTTQTVGAGTSAISYDSAVYTLLSFETDTDQVLRVPVRLLNATDCTTLFTQLDTVFLRSNIPVRTATPQALTLAAATQLAPLQQQFNYPVLMVGLLAIGVVAGVLYSLLRRTIQRRWRLYQLNRRHNRFLRDYNQLIRAINAETATDLANQAIIRWKMYLEQLDRQPYISLTTPELAERMNDNLVTNALREADQMIYGGTFSAQSQPALRVLSDIATQHYDQQRVVLKTSATQALQTSSAESPAVF